ncbi:uncharacterized protein G2W53_010711 [Senna tora]|uniref:Uncharacterized protein n=1 Tax=Senna tora TaxID=362788 RepID=A0A834X057_9FABA|nr:uncharacterized protein G2W53_010711 [Senna tora]
MALSSFAKSSASIAKGKILKGRFEGLLGRFKYGEDEGDMKVWVKMNKCLAKLKS